MRYFFTGFPGFIATALIDELLQSYDVDHIYVLVLERERAKAEAELARFDKRKISIVIGDITVPGLGLTEPLDIDYVFHLAAIYDLAVPQDIAYKVNVTGTDYVNQFVLSLPSLLRYVYFSTSYVAGHREGVIYEHELATGQSFKNHYEATKYEAELLVAATAHRVPTTIIRPGIVVGHSVHGTTTKFDGPYFMLNFFDKLKWLPFIPYLGSGEADGNFVPVDFIIQATLYLAHHKSGTFQLVDPKPYKMRDVYRLLMEHSIGKTPRGTLPLSLAKWALSFRFVRRYLRVEREALDYFTCQAQYDCTNTVAALADSPVSCPDFATIVPTMTRYYELHKHNAAKQVPID